MWNRVPLLPRALLAVVAVIGTATVVWEFSLCSSGIARKRLCVGLPAAGEEPATPGQESYG